MPTKTELNGWKEECFELREKVIELGIALFEGDHLITAPRELTQWWVNEVVSDSEYQHDTALHAIYKRKTALATLTQDQIDALTALMRQQGSISDAVHALESLDAAPEDDDEDEDNTDTDEATVKNAPPPA
jgi:hypothetical protein